MKKLSSYQLINSIFNCESLSSNEKLYMVFLINCYFSFNSQEFYQYDAYISKATDLSIRTLIRVRHNLQSMGLFSTVSKVINNSKALFYTINTDAILNLNNKAVFEALQEFYTESDATTPTVDDNASNDAEMALNPICSVAFESSAPEMAQNDINEAETPQNDILIPEKKESGSNRLKMPLKDVFQKLFKVEELQKWQSELNVGDCGSISIQALGRISAIAKDSGEELETIWMEFVDYVLSEDFTLIPSLENIPDWIWEELKGCFTNKVEVFENDEYGVPVRTIKTELKTKHEINYDYPEMLCKYNLEQQVQLKKYARIVYDDIVNFYNN